MCESDGGVLPGLATEPENDSNKVEDRRGLPDRFKTVQGKTVKLIGTQHSRSPVLVSFSTSKLQGNALLNEHMENPAAFMSDVDSMFDEGFLEDENGNEVDSLVLPIDAIDLAPDLARENNDQNLENVAYNMDVFLDMIIEYMAEYGIQSITSMPGDNFLPKYHTVGISNQQFDPRSASIKVSKRTGFLWGEQVLQKEQVEI